jgi:hypothetical protein
MRNWVAGVMLVLGALLVIAGAVVLVLKAQLNGPSEARSNGPAEPLYAGGPTGADSGSTGSTGSTGGTIGERPGAPVAGRPGAPVTVRVRRLGSAVAKLSEGHRLIAWGVLLLVLAAVAAGAVGFNLNAQTGTS